MVPQAYFVLLSCLPQLTKVKGMYCCLLPMDLKIWNQVLYYFRFSQDHHSSMKQQMNDFFTVGLTSIEGPFWSSTSKSHTCASSFSSMVHVLWLPTTGSLHKLPSKKPGTARLLFLLSSTYFLVGHIVHQ